MKRFGYYLAILTLLAGGLFLLTAPKPNLHDTTHLITAYVDGEMEGTCSATAVGPHVILTATHCEKDHYSDQEINGLMVDKTAVKMVKRVRDGRDHTLLFLSGITFTEYATIVQYKLGIGDEVSYYGNPARLRDLFRKGYVSHVETEKDGNVLYLLDINGFFGDSGAGIFDQDGRLVLVISGGVADGDGAFTVKFGIANGLQFKYEDIMEAESFNKWT
jgi:hypothetical protein